MTEPSKIKVELHDHNQLELTIRFRTGFTLSVNGKEVAMGDDKSSREYVLARFLKAIQDSAVAMLLPPRKEPEKEE